MSGARAKSTLTKQWKLLEALRPAKRGLTVRELCARTGIAKSTLYRYLEVLREAGVPIESTTVVGEARYNLWGHDLPPLGPSALQIAALRLARRALLGLDGTRAATELDNLLEGYARAGASAEAITLAKHRPVAPKLLNKLDHAIHSQRRTRILYRSAKASASTWRIVDPLGIRFIDGHVYFIAHDDTRDAPVTFKLDRISQVVLLADKARPHPEVDLTKLFERSAKAWIGDPIEVAVRLSPAVARFVHEYPLVADQQLQEEPDGSLIVRAKVAGIPEPMRWVLSWGKEAEALEPRELREAVANEVKGAAGKYAAERQPSVMSASRLRQAPPQEAE